MPRQSAVSSWRRRGLIDQIRPPWQGRLSADPRAAGKPQREQHQQQAAESPQKTHPARAFAEPGAVEHQQRRGGPAMALQADRVLLEQVGRHAGGAEQPQLQRQAPGTQAKAESRVASLCVV